MIEEGEARQTEESSEARGRVAVDLADLSPFTWDPATGAVNWDARLKAIWGLPPDAPVDLIAWRSAVHPGDRHRVEEALAQCRNPAGDGVYSIEHRVIGSGDGVERRIAMRGRTRFENGRPSGFVGVGLEIAEPTSNEVTGRANDQALRRFAEQSAHVLWLADLGNRRRTYLNLALREVWGLPQEAFASIESWLGTIHPDDRDSVSRSIERAAEGHVAVLE